MTGSLKHSNTETLCEGVSQLIVRRDSNDRDVERGNLGPEPMVRNADVRSVGRELPSLSEFETGGVIFVDS